MTTTIDQGGTGEEATDFAEGIVEGESELEEPITIKKFSSQSTTPDAFSQAPAPTFTSFPASAVEITMDVAKELTAAGVMVAGDIVLEMRDRLAESNENLSGGTTPGDRVVYRGMEYRLVQRQEPVSLGRGVAFYRTILRRTNSQSDVTGL